jgi:hypothetical protein
VIQRKKLRNILPVLCAENGYGMQAGEHGWARRWTVKLVRDSDRLLTGAPQFVGRPEGEIQWQADVCRVRPSRTSGFSDCQDLWLIAGRSASRAAVCALLPVCARPICLPGFVQISRADLLLARRTAALLPSCASDNRVGERGRIGLGLGTSSIVKSVLHRTRSKILERGSSLIVKSLLHGTSSKRLWPRASLIVKSLLHRTSSKKLGHRASLIVKSQSLAWNKLHRKLGHRASLIVKS